MKSAADRTANQCGWRIGLLLAAFLVSSCASRVWMMVPAKVDLSDYASIGFVAPTGPDSNLNERASRELQQQLLQSRPGIRLIEIESVEDGSELDAIFLGTLDFSNVSPSIGLTSSLVELQARAEIIGSLSVRLIEPSSGATLWLRTSDRTATVASMGVDTTGAGNVGVSDVQATKVGMVAALVGDVTWDFRDQFFQKKVEDIPPSYRLTYSDGVEVYVPPDAD